MSRPIDAPRAARRLLSWFLPDDVRDAIVGDLEEVFRRRVRGDGRWRARVVLA